MSSSAKQGFFKTRAKTIRLLCLLAMLIIPFGLYFAATAGLTWLIYLCLGLMGSTMALLPSFRRGSQHKITSVIHGRQEKI